MFKNVTLEISLKPFKQTNDEYIQNICRKLFEQWKPLIKNREVISVMMWSADGSELLDYTEELDKEFEWCCYVGNANLPLLEDLPLETAIGRRKQFYKENPPKMTYKILKKIVTTFKSEGKTIPDKTPVGKFLGAQANAFMHDMGFEYIWLSNGFGFSFEPWRKEGIVYDGENFHLDKLKETKDNLLDFWKLFRSECRDFDVETRGTNYSVGVDYACHGVPLYDIYK